MTSEPKLSTTSLQQGSKLKMSVKYLRGSGLQHLETSFRPKKSLPRLIPRNGLGLDRSDITFQPFSEYPTCLAME